MKASIKHILAAALLVEGVEDTGCVKLNKIKAVAADLGSTSFDCEDGVAHIQLAGPEAAQQFIDFLDAEDCVEGYDVTHSGDGDEEDIMKLPEETVFGFTLYLGEDHVSYSPEEVEPVEESVGAYYSIGQVPRGPFASLTEAIASKTLDETVAYGRLLFDGSFQPLAEATMVDDDGVTMTEAVKKIQVNFKGVKRIKMQCPAGFKFSTSDNACVKIAGEELAKRRKASVKAVVSRKAGGAALKARAAVRTKKAMNFRKAMGLK